MVVGLLLLVIVVGVVGLLLILFAGDVVVGVVMSVGGCLRLNLLRQCA